MFYPTVGGFLDSPGDTPAARELDRIRTAAAERRARESKAYPENRGIKDSHVPLTVTDTGVRSERPVLQRALPGTGTESDPGNNVNEETLTPRDVIKPNLLTYALLAAMVYFAADSL